MEKCRWDPGLDALLVHLDILRQDLAAFAATTPSDLFVRFNLERDRLAIKGLDEELHAAGRCLSEINALFNIVLTIGLGDKQQKIEQKF